jgi:hypothetical protein
VLRKVIPLRVARAGAPRPKLVVSVSGGRVTQSATKGIARVQHAGPEQAFVFATYHDVRVFVVDADTHGMRLARELHRVYPGAATIAVSRSASSRAVLRRTGVVAAAPGRVAALVRRALRSP